MIVLASASKARRKLIKMCIRNALVGASDVDETRLPGESIENYLRRITLLKAVPFVKKGATVIAADTIIEFNGEIFGKPPDASVAFRYLKALSGNIHRCITGVTILNKTSYAFFVDHAYLKVDKLTDEEIWAYISTGEYRNRAAGYAIQGIASRFIHLIKGDITTVIGLPMRKLCKNLNKTTKNV